MLISLFQLKDFYFFFNGCRLHIVRICCSQMDNEVVPVYTLDEALNHVGFGKFQILVLIYAGLGLVAEAMEVMILSFIGPAIKSEWNLSPAQETLLTSVVFAGLLVGSYSWGFISDNYGRR